MMSSCRAEWRAQTMVDPLSKSYLGLEIVAGDIKSVRALGTELASRFAEANLIIIAAPAGILTPWTLRFLFADTPHLSGWRR